MPRQLSVYLLPSLATAEDIAASTIAIIDVLRATTTICTALANGASEVIPCLHVEDAEEFAKQNPETLLGGERYGLRLDGFDFGNSPAEYTKEKVNGRRIAFTTTNGAKAMHECSSAQRILLASFLNYSATVDALAREAKVGIVCAGTDGEISREDVLLAGALADGLLTDSHNKDVTINDQAEIALDAWREAVRDSSQPGLLGQALRSSQGGRNMLARRQESDIDIAAQIDRYELVPELNLKTWRISVQ